MPAPVRPGPVSARLPAAIGRRQESCSLDPKASCDAEETPYPGAHVVDLLRGHVRSDGQAQHLASQLLGERKVSALPTAARIRAGKMRRSRIVNLRADAEGR